MSQFITDRTEVFVPEFLPSVIIWSRHVIKQKGAEMGYWATKQKTGVYKDNLRFDHCHPARSIAADSILHSIDSLLKVETDDFSYVSFYMYDPPCIYHDNHLYLYYREMKTPPPPLRTTVTDNWVPSREFESRTTRRVNGELMESQAFIHLYPKLLLKQGEQDRNLGPWKTFYHVLVSRHQRER